MNIGKNMSIRDLAVLVADHLARHGIDTVLSGGACVAIYTRNEWVSYDLDFVLMDASQKKKVGKTLEAIGFRPDGRHFRNPDTPYILEFLSPPLSVGEEPVKDVHTLTIRNRRLRLLSPTDCVKDRLAAYYHWNDKPSLEQAARVGLSQRIRLGEIKTWSIREGMKDKVPDFLGELKRLRSGKPAKTG